MWRIVSDFLAIVHAFAGGGRAAQTCLSGVAAAANQLDVLLVRHRWDMP